MNTQNNNTEKKVIVAFHIGRGGRFHNQGHRSFIGEQNLQDLIQKNDSGLFEDINEETGEISLTDCHGNLILPANEVNNLVGKLEFDGDYDTDYCCEFSDCSESEIEIIAQSTDYKSTDLIELLQQATDYQFDKYGRIVTE